MTEPGYKIVLRREKTPELRWPLSLIGRTAYRVGKPNHAPKNGGPILVFRSLDAARKELALAVVTCVESRAARDRQCPGFLWPAGEVLVAELWQCQWEPWPLPVFGAWLRIGSDRHYFGKRGWPEGTEPASILVLTHKLEERQLC